MKINIIIENYGFWWNSYEEMRKNLQTAIKLGMFLTFIQIEIRFFRNIKKSFTMSFLKVNKLVHIFRANVITVIL